MKKLFVLLTAVALVAAFTLPAAAADPAEWGFYGSARVSVWYESLSGDLGDIDTDNFNLNLQGNSRIGANVKAGNLSGRFEYGTGVNTRILWGEYDFGGTSFGVGQHYTPIDMFYSNQVFGSDNDLLNVGGIYSGRRAMLRLKMAGLTVALLNAGLVEPFNAPDGAVNERPLPALEASYGFEAGPVSMKGAGMISAFKFDTQGDVDETITSWLLGLGGKVDVGAVNLWGDIFIGQNVGNYDLYHAGLDEAVVKLDGGIDNTNNWGGIIGATFKTTDMLSFELGLGYTQNDNDSFDQDDDTLCIYGNSVITLAPGVMIIPEIGYFDYGDRPFTIAGDSSAGDLWYAGAKFQINF